jgi:single-strand DNA-binding protein
MSWPVNHCLLEGVVVEAPQIRYTQDNQTPVAEMTLQIDGLRPDDPPGQLKVVGWGSLAQDLQNRIQIGQQLVVEGRLRMQTVTRQDGVKEKRTEFTLSRFHPLGMGSSAAMDSAPAMASAPPSRPQPSQASTASGAPRQIPSRRPAPTNAVPATAAPAPQDEMPAWNASPLVPDLPEDDEIPF